MALPDRATYQPYQDRIDRSGLALKRSQLRPGARQHAFYRALRVEAVSIAARPPPHEIERFVI